MSRSLKKSRPAPERQAPVPDAVLNQFAPEGVLSAAEVEAATRRFKQALLERVLGAELGHHLGQEAESAAADAPPHYRNGTSAKTVLTDDGALPLAIPRDRHGTFAPVLIPKHQRRFTGFDDKILALYARGLTVRDIQAFLDTAASAEAAEAALTAAEAGPWGRRCPTVFAAWRRAWVHVIPSFAFPPDIRRTLYTTNALENVNRQIRKVTKTRGQFPNDDAALKLIWLAVRNLTARWKRGERHWKLAMNQFAILNPQFHRGPDKVVLVSRH